MGEEVDDTIIGSINLGYTVYDLYIGLLCGFISGPHEAKAAHAANSVANKLVKNMRRAGSKAAPTLSKQPVVLMSKVRRTSAVTQSTIQKPVKNTRPTELILPARPMKPQPTVSPLPPRRTTGGKECAEQTAASERVIWWLVAGAILALAVAYAFYPSQRTAINELTDRGFNVANLYESDWEKVFSTTDNGEELVQLMKTAGLDLNEPYVGTQLLHKAVEEGNPAVVKLFLQYGADINKVDDEGETLLHKAVRDGKVAIVKLFLQSGADINKAYKYGWTPLYLAVEKESAEIVKLLLQSGADINKADEYGRTPLDWAEASGNREIIQLLRAAQSRRRYYY